MELEMHIFIFLINTYSVLLMCYTSPGTGNNRNEWNKEHYGVYIPMGKDRQ